MRSLAVILVCLFAAQAHAQDAAVVRKMSENKFTPVEGLPSCVTQAVQSGDPSKGAAVILFKAKAGCVIPWHWHTPTERIMVVAGSAKLQLKDSASTGVLGPGSYALLPTKNVHQFTCSSACTAFVTSDAAFDIHYVDASGKEIPAETALMKKK